MPASTVTVTVIDATGNRHVMAVPYTVGAATDFDTWAPGTVQPNGRTDPGVTNVGPRYPDSELTVVTGDFTPTAGTVYQKLDIRGRLIPNSTSTGAKFYDCIVRGKKWGQGPTYNGAPANDAVFNNGYNGRGVLLDHCLVDGSGYESVWADGLRGNNFTAQYCEIMRAVDGFGAIAGSKHGDTLLENSRIHNGYYTGWMNSATGQPYANFPTSPSDRRCHNDGVHIQGWSGYTFRGNYIGGRRYDVTAASHQTYRDYLNPAHLAYIAGMDAADDFSNSCFMIQNNHSAAAMVGALIELNWLAGGDASVNLNSNNAYGDKLAGVTIRKNRFIRQSTWGNKVGTYAIYRTASCAASISENVWDNDGSPVTIVTY